jgi:arylsulfatase
MVNLGSDPFERADTDANGYNNWWIDHLFPFVPAQAHVADQFTTFAKFPPPEICQVQRRGVFE